MSPHSSDTLAISFDGESKAFLHRKDPDNNSITLQTLELSKFEVFIFLESLADNPDYTEKMLSILERLNIARPNHRI